MRFSEMMQKADVIFVGTVTGMSPRMSPRGKTIFTDVTFDVLDLIHQKPAVTADVSRTITLSFAGGQIGDRIMRFEDVPTFTVGQTYVILALYDGEPYSNPVLGGTQGLFRVLTDSRTGEWHPLATGRRAMTAAPNGTFRLTGPVEQISEGVAELAAPREVRRAAPPIAADPAAPAWTASEEISTADPPLTLAQFADVLRRMAAEQLAQNAPSAVAPRIPSRTLAPDRVGPILDASGPGLRGDDPCGSLPFACGAHDLDLVMEQVSESEWAYSENLFGMFLWNLYMDIYRYVPDDGTWGDNGDNEFGGFATDAQLKDHYDMTWGDGIIALCHTDFFFSCGEITEADIVFRAGYDWRVSFQDTFNQEGRYLYRPTMLHELGHSWGSVRECDEDYAYDVLTVMHAYYNDIVEDGYGIHAADAQLIRVNYDDQRIVLPIRDMGVESYYAGLSTCGTIDPGYYLCNSTTNLAAYSVGQSITVSNLVVENMSVMPIANVRLRLYLSTDDAISSADYQLGGPETYWYWNSFGGEATSLGNYTATIPVVSSGNYWVGAIVTTQGSEYQLDDFPLNNATFLAQPITVRPPGNDDCPNAFPISEGTTLGTTYAATNITPAPCGLSTGTPDVWYRYLALCTGTLYIDSCGSSFDTVLAVYDGCPAVGIYQLTCNDDCLDPLACYNTYQSCMPLSVVAGAAYWLRVTGFNGAIGDFELHLNMQPDPANDSCANAFPISNGVQQESTCGAADETGWDSSCVQSPDVTNTPDVWYSYTAVRFGLLRVHTCGSNYDTIVSVHSACPDGGSDHRIACNDDCGGTPCGGRDSCLEIAVSPGQTYLIRVTGYFGSRGDFTLTVSDSPLNNIPVKAFILDGAHVAGSTVNATADGDSSCSGPGDPDVWYVYTPQYDERLTLDTCGSTFDTALTLYDGSTGAPGNELACNDDCQACPCPGTGESSLTALVLAGNSYYVRLSGANGATGDFSLNAGAVSSNDACQSAWPVTEGTYSFRSAGAVTDGPDEPGACDFLGYTQVDSDIWYCYTGNCADKVTVSLCDSEYDTKLAIYEGCACPASESAYACNEEHCGEKSQVTFQASPGQPYLIRIGGYLGDAGLGTMVIACGECIVNADCDDGDPCTDDACSGGSCTHPPATCDDGDACSEDLCDAQSGCYSLTIDCDDGDECTDDSCDPQTGCVYNSVVCDDGDACTLDYCDSGLGCIHDPLDCYDGDECTVESCDMLAGCLYPPKDCDDGDPCTIDSCESSTGCVNEPLVCDDGLFCNGEEICDVGGCAPGGNPCFGDWCDESSDQCISYGSGDADADGDVDLADFRAFQNCFGRYALPGCEALNLAGDGNIDIADFAEFARIFTGP